MSERIEGSIHKAESDFVSQAIPAAASAVCKEVGSVEQKRSWRTAKMHELSRKGDKSSRETSGRMNAWLLVERERWRNEEKQLRTEENQDMNLSARRND